MTHRFKARLLAAAGTLALFSMPCLAFAEDAAKPVATQSSASQTLSPGTPQEIAVWNDRFITKYIGACLLDYNLTPPTTKDEVNKGANRLFWEENNGTIALRHLDFFRLNGGDGILNTAKPQISEISSRQGDALTPFRMIFTQDERNALVSGTSKTLGKARTFDFNGLSVTTNATATEDMSCGNAVNLMASVSLMDLLSRMVFNTGAAGKAFSDLESAQMKSKSDKDFHFVRGDFSSNIGNAFGSGSRDIGGDQQIALDLMNFYAQTGLPANYKTDNLYVISAINDAFQVSYTETKNTAKELSISLGKSTTDKPADNSAGISLKRVFNVKEYALAVKVPTTGQTDIGISFSEPLWKPDQAWKIYNDNLSVTHFVKGEEKRDVAFDLPDAGEAPIQDGQGYMLNERYVVRRFIDKNICAPGNFEFLHPPAKGGEPITILPVPGIDGQCEITFSKTFTAKELALAPISLDLSVTSKLLSLGTNKITVTIKPVTINRVKQLVSFDASSEPVPTTDADGNLLIPGIKLKATNIDWTKYSIDAADAFDVGITCDNKLQFDKLQGRITNRSASGSNSPTIDLVVFTPDGKQFQIQTSNKRCRVSFALKVDRAEDDSSKQYTINVTTKSLQSVDTPAPGAAVAPAGTAPAVAPAAAGPAAAAPGAPKASAEAFIDMTPTTAGDTDDKDKKDTPEM